MFLTFTVAMFLFSPSFTDAAVVHNTWNITYVDTNWKEFTWIWTITFSDWEHTITMLDRNLWATVAWTWCDNVWCMDDSYWYLFQWWNNYWFSNTGILPTSESRVDVSGYKPSEYYNWTFIINNYNWATDESIRNLWWWSWDDYENNWWVYSDNEITDRKGPCPTWYHIPSVWETNELLLYRSNACSWCNIELAWNRWLFYFDGRNYHWWDFWEDFLVPFAGFFMEDWDYIYNWRAPAYRWTSSPIPKYYYEPRYQTHSFFFRMMLSYIRTNEWNSWWGWYPIRCFADSNLFRHLSFETFWWTSIDEQIVKVNKLWTKPDTPIKTWYTFSWWYITSDFSWEMFNFDETPIDNDIVLYANRIINQHVISFNTDWWTTIDPIVADYDTEILLPENPTKNWYRFIWWDIDIPSRMPDEDLVINAQWEKLGSSWWWGSSRWSVNGWNWDNKNNSDDSNSSNNNQLSNEDKSLDKDAELSNENSVESPNDMDKLNDAELPDLAVINNWYDSVNSWNVRWQSSKWYSQEMYEAYEFAYNNDITSIDSIENSMLDWDLTRIQMAKMLSKYSINVLWMLPDVSRNNSFNDVSEELDKDYNNWVTLAYQLWIMWINMPNNKFRPDDIVTRWEFVTALSRLLYNTSDWEYELTSEYYTNHMQKLIQEWIVTKVDPTMKEKRWYVMIMLKRSIK